MKIKILAEIYATVPDDIAEQIAFEIVEQDIRDLLYVGTEYTNTPIDFIEFDELNVHLCQKVEEETIS